MSTPYHEFVSSTESNRARISTDWTKAVVPISVTRPICQISEETFIHRIQYISEGLSMFSYNFSSSYNTHIEGLKGTHLA